MNHYKANYYGENSGHVSKHVYSDKTVEELFLELPYRILDSGSNSFEKDKIIYQVCRLVSIDKIL